MIERKMIEKFDVVASFSFLVDSNTKFNGRMDKSDRDRGLSRICKIC